MGFSCLHLLTSYEVILLSGGIWLYCHGAQWEIATLQATVSKFLWSTRIEGTVVVLVVVFHNFQGSWQEQIWPHLLNTSQESSRTPDPLDSSRRKEEETCFKCVSDRRENLGICARGWGFRRDWVKAGRWEERKYGCCLTMGSYSHSFIWGIFEDTCVTYRQD